MKHTYAFEDPAATSLETSGGKGANLSLLVQRGFPVPRGFVIAAPERGASMERVSGLVGGDAAEMQAACALLQEEVMGTALLADACGEVEERLRAFPEDTMFSVRSSSTMEDLAGAAFAGQHETFLNVAAADVLERVVACRASLWAHRAVAYRERQGYDHARAAMAVVVQEMVRSEVAGVGFSMNPVTGNPAEMVINANFGLGESVVSGEGEVDQWVIEKAGMVVRAVEIGNKTSSVLAAAGGGTVEEHPDEAEAMAPSLDDRLLGMLAELLVKVEDSYGFPQDTEWAFAEGKLWLLQSRPVTTIPPHWTRDESAERFPNMITPLTWDFVESGFHRSLNHSFGLLGFPPYQGKWFAQFDHYIYGNQNAVELYAKRAPFTVRSLDELRAMIPELRGRYAWVQELPVAWMRDLDHYLVTLGRFQAEPLEGRSPMDLWRHVLAVNEHGARYFLPNIAISIAHGTIYRILGGLLEMVAEPAEGDRMFERLMAWCETKTGQINKELFDLALLAKEQPELHDLILKNGAAGLSLSELTAEFPVFGERFGRFLRDHGHREVDFDAYVATWGESPEIVMNNIRLILSSPMDQPPVEKQRELKIQAQQAEMDLFAMLPPDLHYFFHELLRLARVYTALDDLEHYQTTRLTPALRRGLRALGERLVEGGVLAEPMDIFFARQQQIEDAMNESCAAGWEKFSEQVEQQKEAYLRDKERKPAWVMGVETPPTADGGNMLHGLAGSAGVAEGPVFQVMGPEQFATFPKGAVLVARTTNPAWTPLFYNAAAVITESGGPLSHGAVTAREMGIPAVMSVRDSLARLANGQRVRVDGRAGRVELL